MSYQSILLVKLRAIGDSVLALPSLEALRRGFPKARICVLTPRHSAELFSADPRVDEVISYPRPPLAALKRHVEFYEFLQARRFDLAVCLHASFRTALIGWMSGAGARSIRNHSGPDWFCNLPASEPKEPKNIIERDFDALRALGLAPSDRRPRLHLSAKARKEAAALARKARLPKGRSLLLFPGAGKPEKRWPMDRFMELKASLEKRGRRCAFVVAPGEEAPAGSLASSSLLTLGALCAHAGWALGNDSGPRHIAAACGARTLTLFGPESLREWHPYERQDGHWALKPGSGRMLDLGSGEVFREALAWQKR